MEVPQSGCIVKKCYDGICDVNNKLERELEMVTREPYHDDTGRDLPGLGFTKWRKEAKELGASKPQPRRLAFIGRTGVGKSTAINAILGAPVLSARADGACTAVQTEIIYEELPPSTWRAMIKFIKKDEWKDTLSNMLDDLDAHMDGVNGDSGPAMDAWETLKEVYPHLRALPFPPPYQNIDVLLEHEVVESKFGTEKKMYGKGFDDLELQLRPYLTSYTKIVEGETPESSVWHLVDSVRIYGAFDVLASRAVTLVDVPGFGDANKTRTKRTEEYIKSAEVVVLVADIKRAADDQVMRDYFVKFLQQRIRIDGSMESLLIVLTGADVRINEDQLHYLDSKQRHVIQKMCQAIDRLNKSLDELEISSTDGKTIAPHDRASFNAFTERQQRKDQIASQLKIQQTAKNTYVAHQRSARVREAFLQLYRQVYFTISKQGAACEPPPLPVFCVGSTDFSQLLETDKRRRAPMVFADPKDTGIPLLSQHIHDLGLRNAFSDLDALVHRCNMLHKETKSFFFGFKVLDPKLTAYEDEARGLVECLKETVYETRQTSDDKIEKSMDKLEQVLQIEAKNAAKHSLNVIEDLGISCRYQTYRAIMKRAGEWQSIDLNENLVDGMLDGTVSSVWHDLFEDFLRSELESLVMVIRASCDATIQSIRDGVKRKLPATHAAHIERLCDDFCPLDMLKPARMDYMLGVRSMQRKFGGSFKELLRIKVEAHYHKVARQSGIGMFQRMKDMNEKKFSETQELYAGLVEDVMKLIREAIADGEESFDTALDRLYKHFERSFVHIQETNKISKETQKKMRIFLEKEYRKPLAELTTIMDEYKERNATLADSDSDSDSDSDLDLDSDSDYSDSDSSEVTTTTV